MDRHFSGPFRWGCWRTWGGAKVGRLKSWLSCGPYRNGCGSWNTDSAGTQAVALSNGFQCHLMRLVFAVSHASQSTSAVSLSVSVWKIERTNHSFSLKFFKVECCTASRLVYTSNIKRLVQQISSTCFLRVRSEPLGLPGLKFLNFVWGGCRIGQWDAQLCHMIHGIRWLRRRQEK